MKRSTRRSILLAVVTHEADLAAQTHREVHLVDGRIVRDRAQTPKPSPNAPRPAPPSAAP